MVKLKGSLVHKYPVLQRTVAIDFGKLKKATDLTANPPAADATNLTIVTGTYGSSAPVIQSEDAHSATVTPKTRFQYVVPSTYEPGNYINVIIHAGMKTTVADTSSYLQVYCYRNAAPTVNIGPAYQSINSLTAADYTFALTTTNVVPGEILDFELATAITDGANSTAVIATINSIQMQLVF